MVDFVWYSWIGTVNIPYIVLWESGSMGPMDPQHLSFALVGCLGPKELREGEEVAGT